MGPRILFLLLVISLLPFTALQALEKNDSIKKKEISEKPAKLTPYHWNVIKINPTPMLIWQEVRNITISYERLIAKDQSVSLQLGYLLFPRLIDDTIAHIAAITGKQKYGVNIAVDYRYYPFSRNRRPAPDGLYIGAFVSYYGFKFRNDIDIVKTTVDQNGYIGGKLNILNVGMMLGYQFIFWKRFTLDMLLFGPSISYYSADLRISGTLDPDQIKNLDKEMVDKLLKRFPFLGTIFSADGLEFTGSRASLSIGFRYSIQLGVHF
jgi:hypothetical protein